jgi:hypothetical protein
MKSTVAWIATPGFALLAMTAQGFFSSLLAASRSFEEWLQGRLHYYTSILFGRQDRRTKSLPAGLSPRGKEK